MTPEIRGVADANEREAVRAMLRTEFEVAPGVGSAFADLYDSLLNLDPSVTTDCSRVAIDSGNVIGHALLAPRNIRICGSDCPAGLIGMVVVQPEFQGKGVGSALVEDIHHLADIRGLGLLVLAGDPAYYRRFGYRDAFVRAERVIQIPESDSSGPSTLRPALPSDIDSLVRLSSQSVPSGSVTPTRDRWDWILRTLHPAGLLKTNPAMLGHIADDDRLLIHADGSGYARVAIGHQEATVYEGATVARGESRMFDQIIKLCESQGITKLTLRGLSATGLADSEGQPETYSDLEFQFKIINLGTLLTSAQPGLESRISEDFPAWKGTLLIHTESGSILVSRQSGDLRLSLVSDDQAASGTSGSIKIPEWGVGRMLLGQDDLTKVLRSSGVSTDLDRALGSLFQPSLPEFLLVDAI